MVAYIKDYKSSPDSVPAKFCVERLFRQTSDHFGRRVPETRMVTGENGRFPYDACLSPSLAQRQQSTSTTSSSNNSPPGSDVLKNVTVRSEMRRSLLDSKPSDPTNRHEEGGYYGREADGSWGFRRWPRGQGSSIPVPTRNSNGSYIGLNVVGEWHTHPNPPVDQNGLHWVQGPHSGDIRGIISENYSGDSFILSRSHVYAVDPTGNNRTVGTVSDVFFPKP